jgi:DNA-binding XRE family transcriptional regulator
MVDLPQRYWHAALEKVFSPETWAKRENDPAWVAMMLPIVTKQDCLKAMRYSIGMTGDDFCKEVGLYNGTLSRIEAGSLDLDSTPALKLLDFYTRYQSEHPQMQLFNRVVFDRLGEKNELTHAQRVLPHRGRGGAALPGF